jgi:hypothetical protein
VFAMPTSYAKTAFRGKTRTIQRRNKLYLTLEKRFKVANNDEITAEIEIYSDSEIKSWKYNVRVQKDRTVYKDFRGLSHHPTSKEAEERARKTAERLIGKVREKLDNPNYKFTISESDVATKPE